MDQATQGGSDDLQAAIDSITKNAAAANAGDASSVEAQIQSSMGIPPVPPTEGAPDLTPPAELTPDVTAEPAAVDAAPAEEAPAEETAAAEAAPAEESSASVESGGTSDPELIKVKESALKELIPLLDKTDLEATEKFAIYEDALSTTKDKSIVESALLAAKDIADEKVKAESLLKLVKLIDTM